RPHPDPLLRGEGTACACLFDNSCHLAPSPPRGLCHLNAPDVTAKNPNIVGMFQDHTRYILPGGPRGEGRGEGKGIVCFAHVSKLFSRRTRTATLPVLSPGFGICGSARRWRAQHGAPP